MISATEMMNLGWERTSLKQVIKQMPNPTRESVKKMYGDIGVDIFEGKKKVTILPEKDLKAPAKLINKINNWLIGNGKVDYEEKDSVKDLVLKYGYNNIRCTYAELEEKFGQEGIRIANIFKVMGYFRT